MKYLGGIEVQYRFRRHVGPRYVHGDVVIDFATSESYRFASEVQWPSDNWTAAVERGAIDGLREAGYDPDQGVQITLREVQVQEVDSCEAGFYKAAKCAARSCRELTS